MELNTNNLNEYYHDEEIFIIPNKFTSIGEFCFYNSSPLKEIIIPDSVTSIGDYCFDGCLSLKEISIPNSVISIGDDCFNYCKSLEKIIIPNSVTSLGKDCFEYCNSLEEIIIPDEPSMVLLKELVNQEHLDLDIIHTLNHADIKDKIEFVKIY